MFELFEFQTSHMCSFSSQLGEECLTSLQIKLHTLTRIIFKKFGTGNTHYNLLITF